MSLVRNLLVATMIGAAFPIGCTAITEKSPKEAFTDAEIITRAKAMFAADPVVKARNIHVTAVKGDVTLTGVVQSDGEADRAVELVRAIPGVTSVTSVLKVESA
jgi:osmotically-inducible protein OsmY